MPKELLDQTAFEDEGAYPGGQASWVWKNGSTSEITKAEDLIGKSVFLAGVNYTITGILDTGFDKMLYKDLEGTVEEEADALLTILWNRFRQERKQGLHCLAFVGTGAVERLAETYPQVIGTEGMKANLIYGDVTLPIRHIGRYSDFVKSQSKATIPWGNYEDANETPRKELKDQEFVFPVVYKETDGILDTTTSLGLPELYPEGTYRL